MPPRPDATTTLVLSTAVVGVALGLALAVAWILLFQRSPQEAAAIAAALGALAYGGKETGIPVGLAAGGSPIQIGLFIFLTDVAFALVAYAVVHFAIDSWARGEGFFGRWLRRSQARAEAHAETVHRWGPLGLFLFMLIPFAFNGPLLGALLGRIAGLSAFITLPILVAAVAVTTLLWTTLYALGFHYAMEIHPDLPAMIAALAVATVTVVLFFMFFLSGRAPPESRIELPPREPPVVSPGTAE